MSYEFYTISDNATYIPDYFKARHYLDINKLNNSKTIYIGNLSFSTNENQIWELFSQCGIIINLIMGINRQTKDPCGFCFIEYENRWSAMIAIESLNNTRLDDRLISVDLDCGFEEGRQYGRGVSGCQRRDEYRKTEISQRLINSSWLGIKKERPPTKNHNKDSIGDIYH